MQKFPGNTYIFNFYQFYGNYFKLNRSPMGSISADPNKSRFVFTVFDKKLNVEIQQVHGSEYYEIDYQYRKAKTSNTVLFDKDYTKNKIHEDSNNTEIAAQLKKLVPDFKSNIPIIGTYLNSQKDVILFFRLEHDIIYCTIDQVFTCL